MLRAGVDPVGREHAAVGGERERQVGEVEAHLRGDRPARRARRRSSARRALGGLGHGGNLPVACRGVTAPYEIRVIGDPVLRQRAAEVTDIDGKLARLAEDMLTTMYEAPGLGLAAPQVGVQKRLFVYDVGEGPQTIVNPEIVESRGRVGLRRGLPVDPRPGLRARAAQGGPPHRATTSTATRCRSRPTSSLARCFQHELDHLDGVLFIERLDDDDRKAAMKIIREQRLTAADLADAEVGGAAARGGGFSLR